MLGLMTRIVVGVDGSAGSGHALGWALEEARLRGAAVDVVHAWHVPYVGGAEMVAAMIDPVEMERGARQTVEQMLSTVKGLDEGITVNPILRQGSAGSVLVKEAEGADLLVVGSRGHGGFTGLLLGSVSQQVVHHAPCPVVIVPHVEPGDSR